MNVAAATLLGLGLAAGQPPAADFYPITNRTFKLPINYAKERAGIRQVQLFVSRDQGATWAQEAEMPPDRDFFAYVAKDDGVYWFNMVVVDMKGGRDPLDLTKEPPAMKALVDTVKPAVRVTDAQRAGGDVEVRWQVEDKNPDDAATKVAYRPAGSDGLWQEVTVPATSRTGVRFKPGLAGPVVVKVSVADLAGNKGEAEKEIGAAGGELASTSFSAGAVPPVMPHPVPPVSAVPPPSPAPPFDLGPPPVVTPPAVVGMTPPPAPAFVTPTPPAPAPGGPTYLASGQGKMTPDPVEWTNVKPAGSTTATALPGNALAVGSGVGPVSAPAGDANRAQVVNTPRFDLAFEVDARGPSGISRVDLWVTRDGGRQWLRWSEHDGRGPVRVALDVPGNGQVEGPYGFRLVPVSGAGLSDAAPVPGTPPDLNVVLDVTPPLVKILPPASDPGQPDTLVVQWEATDRNLGDAPIVLEWSDAPAGPWRPLGGAPEAGVVTASNTAPSAARLANSGRFAWRVPANLPTHRVFLKVTARDLGGNVTEVMTREPLLVDLVKPRARIQGIVPVSAVVPR